VTSLEKLVRANRWRIKKGKFTSDETDGWNGWFLVPLEGELWTVCISDGMGWKHLSISNAQKKVLPGWTVMSRIKDLFFADDEWAIQFFPAKEDYINDCEWCLHLWVPLNEPLPKPSIVLV
jgi:hypothetical protein